MAKGTSETAAEDQAGHTVSLPLHRAEVASQSRIQLSAIRHLKLQLQYLQLASFVQVHYVAKGCEPRWRREPSGAMHKSGPVFFASVLFMRQPV